MQIALATDHNGVALSEAVRVHLETRGLTVRRLGPEDPAESVDYPPIVAAVSRLVRDGDADRGIVIGGIGSGESIAANKVRGVRAVLASDHLTARIARENNDAHVLVLGAMVVGTRLAIELVDAFLDARFTGGRHVPRLAQIEALERDEALGPE